MSWVMAGITAASLGLQMSGNKDAKKAGGLLGTLGSGMGAMGGTGGISSLLGSGGAAGGGGGMFSAGSATGGAPFLSSSTPAVSGGANWAGMLNNAQTGLGVAGKLQGLMGGGQSGGALQSSGLPSSGGFSMAPKPPPNLVMPTKVPAAASLAGSGFESATNPLEAILKQLMSR